MQSWPLSPPPRTSLAARLACFICFSFRRFAFPFRLCYCLPASAKIRTYQGFAFRRRDAEKNRTSCLGSLSVGNSDTSMAYKPLCKLQHNLQETSRSTVPYFTLCQAARDIRNGLAGSQHHFPASFPSPGPPIHPHGWLHILPSFSASF